MAYQHVREEPPAPSDVDPDLPPAFDPVVLRALRKDPEDRFPTGAAFLATLEEAAADPHAGPGRHTPPLDAVPPPSSARCWAPRPRSTGPMCRRPRSR